MALSKNEIQKRSDARRGVKTVAVKLPLATIELLGALVEKTGKN